MIGAKSRILFQGDSITDAGRDREIGEPNNCHALGRGYANHIASRLLRQRPADQLAFYNRGVSGNRIVDLYARWKVDALHLLPDLISILIGVNDTWHEFAAQNGVEVDRYETVYRMLLEYTKHQLPNVQLVLCEPFVLPCGVVQEAWVAEMRERQRVVRELSQEFDARFVPFQSAMDKHLERAAPEYWATDGVHPTAAGHSVLAECWIETVT